MKTATKTAAYALLLALLLNFSGARTNATPATATPRQATSA